jgi:hypothetical protein
MYKFEHKCRLRGRMCLVRFPLRACSVIFNPYGLEGIDTDWERF